MGACHSFPVDLSAIRLERKLTLEQISDLTKIRVSWLRAVEEGRWGELPDGIYRRSYVRQYASAIGVNAQELLAAWPGES